MIVDSLTASDSVSYGTLSLAQSLLRSRRTWLTTAFGQISLQDAHNSRELVCSTEVQIGPHIYYDTCFYYVQGPSATASNDTVQAEPDSASAIKPTDKMHPTLPPPLAFEFGDSPGTLFCLPKDLGLAEHDEGNGDTIHAYFYASPTRPRERLPSTILQDWPDYHVGEKTLTRIDFAIRNASSELHEYLRSYAAFHRTKVWREYRANVCQQCPTVRYWPSFVPASIRPDLPIEMPMVRTLKRQSRPYVVRHQRKATPPPTPRQPSVLHTSTKPPLANTATSCAGGGKSGYNLAMAAAQKRYMLECDSTSSSDEQMDIEEEQTVDADMGDNETERLLGVQRASSGRLAAHSNSSCRNRGASTPPRGGRPAKASSAKRLAILTSQRASSKVGKVTLSQVGRGRKCSYCGCNETPIWRRGPGGTGTLCNACGVKWKLGKILQD